MDFKSLLEYEINKEKERIAYFYPYTTYQTPYVICKGSVRNDTTRIYLKGEDGKRVYAGKDRLAEVDLIRKKRFAETSIKIMSQNVKALERALRSVNNYDTEAINALLPAVYHIQAAPPSDDVVQSESTKNPEGLKYTTSFGLKVRSKNELIIAEQLKIGGLKSFYEKKLLLLDGFRQVTYHPDFTIPLGDGRVMFWEHFGKMDDKQYADEALHKLKVYYDNGIYAPENLIITMDSEDKPINASTIARIIESQLLPFK